ncbi:MAG: response regulator [Anaerolineae bacterium]|nr:response regulator [Anaerolineae bacterium]
MNHKLYSGDPVEILLIEDNPAHAELVKRTLHDHQVANVIHHVGDGEAALHYLYHEGAYTDESRSPRPQVILLDLRLPRIDGLEVLRRIKADDALKTIPVVILSTSKAEEDLARAYHHHANSYLVKPVDFEKFVQMMRDLGFYWLIWNQNPWS